MHVQLDIVIGRKQEGLHLKYFEEKLRKKICVKFLMYYLQNLVARFTVSQWDLP